MADSLRPPPSCPQRKFRRWWRLRPFDAAALVFFLVLLLNVLIVAALWHWTW